MSLFLWEIGCEDIPARMQQSAIVEFEQRVRQSAKDHDILFDQLETWISPRRLAVRLSGVSKITPQAETKTGPLVAQGDEAFGRFCAKWGVQPQNCTSISTPKGLAWSAVVTPPDIDLSQRLGAMGTQVLNTMVWQKRMIWDQEHVSWIRPIRWMLCLLDDQVVPWTWSGIDTNRWTETHRLMTPDPLILSSSHQADWGSSVTHRSMTTSWRREDQNSHPQTLSWSLHPKHQRWGAMLDHAQSYEALLHNLGIMVSSAERRHQIQDEINHLANTIHGGIDQTTAQELLDENVGLTQWPQAVLCSFDPAFLVLPPEVIITALHLHQRCFCVVHPDNPQKLMPYFVMIADGFLPSDPIRIGYERVVTARLQDAVYFWEQDQRVSLSDRRCGLKERVFFSGLGSLYDKTDRIESLVTWISHQTKQVSHLADLQQLSRMCKSDLLTAMVGEFPTLQGIMGKYYAQQEKISSEQAHALTQPYRLARWTVQQVQEQSTLWGAWLTAADSIDTLVGFFALGKKPSGSKDPLALRRTCHGLLKALIAHGHNVPLPHLLEHAVNVYHQQNYLKDISFSYEEWWGFATDRLDFILKEAGIKLSKPNILSLFHKWQTIWDTPTAWQQAIHCYHVHQTYPTAVQTYERLVSLQQSCGQIISVTQRDGLTTSWEKAALDQTSSPLSEHTMDTWTSIVTNLLDNVSLQDTLWGPQRLGLVQDLIQLWQTWVPLDAPDR